MAIVVWKYADRFSLISAAPALPAKRLKNPERIREVLSDANDQFKNGIKYKDAPCLLTIFHDRLDVPDETIINSAFYGNLKFVFPNGQPEKGKLVFDKDGGWIAEKNRATSAVLYVRNGGEPLIVHNYWARTPFPVGLFDWKEVSLLPNGKFQEADFAKSPIPRSVFTRIASLPGSLFWSLGRLLGR